MQCCGSGSCMPEGFQEVTGTNRPGRAAAGLGRARQESWPAARRGPSIQTPWSPQGWANIRDRGAARGAGSPVEQPQWPRDCLPARPCLPRPAEPGTHSHVPGSDPAGPGAPPVGPAAQGLLGQMGQGCCSLAGGQPGSSQALPHRMTLGSTGCEDDTQGQGHTGLRAACCLHPLTHFPSPSCGTVSS